MTQQPDEPDNGLDEDAAWQAIVENYGDAPDVAPDPPSRQEPSPEARRSSRSGERFETNVFDRSYLDAQTDGMNSAATWDDEGHFVPPPAPPVPRATPRRRAAWFGLFGAPALMLLAVVLGWTYPQWFLGGLVLAFIAGFVYLVATMPRKRDDWPGDDGAVV